MGWDGWVGMDAAATNSSTSSSSLRTPVQALHAPHNTVVSSSLCGGLQPLDLPTPCRTLPHFLPCARCLILHLRLPSVLKPSFQDQFFCPSRVPLRGTLPHRCCVGVCTKESFAHPPTKEAALLPACPSPASLLPPFPKPDAAASHTHNMRRRHAAHLLDLN